MQRRPRNGWLATFNGRIYRSTHIKPDGTVRLIYDSVSPPDDLEFTKHPQADVWTRTVRADDCDRVVQVSTAARYGRYQCYIESISDDGMALLFLSREAPGFEMVERGVYKKTVHVSELREYHEIHTDELFRYWRDQTFGAGSRVRP